MYSPGTTFQDDMDFLSVRPTSSAKNTQFLGADVKILEG